MTKNKNKKINKILLLLHFPLQLFLQFQKLIYQHPHQYPQLDRHPTSDLEFAL